MKVGQRSNEVKCESLPARLYNNFPTIWPLCNQTWVVDVFVCVGLLNECAQVGETHYGDCLVNPKYPFRCMIIFTNAWQNSFVPEHHLFSCQADFTFLPFRRS